MKSFVEGAHVATESRLCCCCTIAVMAICSMGDRSNEEEERGDECVRVYDGLVRKLLLQYMNTVGDSRVSDRPAASGQ